MELRDGVLPVESDDLERVVEVWEASVRATHHFLAEGDIELFRPLVRAAIRGDVELSCARRHDGPVVGFVGCVDAKVEMLFIDPDWRGRGVGRRLLRHAVDVGGARTVDVNEQNEQAVGFYDRMGFEVIGRSELDGMGMPYPLLHMELGTGGLRG